MEFDKCLSAIFSTSVFIKNIIQESFIGSKLLKIKPNNELKLMKILSNKELFWNGLSKNIVCRF